LAWRSRHRSGINWRNGGANENNIAIGNLGVRRSMTWRNRWRQPVSGKIRNSNDAENASAENGMAALNS
jgi:hypothetical protein